MQDWFGFGGGQHTLLGERHIAVNDPIKNKHSKFLHNSVSTCKYNVVTFLPKFLFEQFSKSANLFFMFTGIIQVVKKKKFGFNILLTLSFRLMIP